MPRIAAARQRTVVEYDPRLKAELDRLCGAYRQKHLLAAALKHFLELTPSRRRRVITETFAFLEDRTATLAVPEQVV